MSILPYMENTPIDKKVEPNSANFDQNQKKNQIPNHLLRHDRMGLKAVRNCSF